MARRGLFITFEGIDGCGKTTQSRRAATFFKKKGRRVLMTREPGGGHLAEKIRALLLNPKSKIVPSAELFLYEAARADHVANKIRPALQKGHVVICDRFTDATMAYQGWGRGLPKKMILSLNHWATGGLKPDLTVWLDVDPKVGLLRARGRNGKKGLDRLEKEGLPLQRRVRNGYAALARMEPKRVRRVSAEMDPKKIEGLVVALLKKRFGGKP